MNFPHDSGEHDNDKTSSSDEDEDTENLFPHSSSILVETFFSNNHKPLDISDDDDDDDDEESDIENDDSFSHQFSRQNRLCTILRQSNHLVELKLNLLHQSLRHTISDSDMSKETHDRWISSTRTRRLYLPTSSIVALQTEITNWLQASTCLIDSISTSTYHRRCWSQLLLTYFIERRFVNLQFLLCTHAWTLTTTTSNEHSCSIHQYACIPEEDASKLCSILQKGSRFNIDANIFDHLRRIIVIKTLNENSNLQQLYVKQLTSLKQSLTNMNHTTNLSISVASIYSKVLLFLSSLYSIKAETMQTLFCQHLLHNPMYSYLITS